MLASMSEALKLRPDGFRERGAQVTRLEASAMLVVEPIPAWVGHRVRGKLALAKSRSSGGIL